MTRDSPQDFIEQFTEFYLGRYRHKIEEFVQGDAEEQSSLSLDWQELEKFDAELAEAYRKQPVQLRDAAEEALRQVDRIENEFEDLRARIHNLPDQTAVSSLRSQHLNTLVSVYGTVIRVSETVSQPTDVAWECRRCGTLTFVLQPAHIQTIDDATKPDTCQGCEQHGPFEVENSKSEFHDAQSIVIREPLQGTDTDDTRSSLFVDLAGDLTGSVKIGDHIVATGVLNLATGNRDLTGTLPDKYLTGHSVTLSRANKHISLSDEDERQIRELTHRSGLYKDLRNSIAPTIQGYETVKMAVLLQLFSGVHKELPEGRDVRGGIHLLLFGDPGTAKSVIAKQATRLAPRAALVDGSDTSAAGLTSAAAVSSQSGGTTPWTIEGGVIAVANEGLACIDNFDQLRSEAQNALHGILEHQEINASKATETRSISAETSVLATANPKYGRFDQYEPLSKQLDLPPQLISEFDLILTIADQPDPDHDEQVANRIIETQHGGELATRNRELNDTGRDPDTIDQALQQITPPVDHDLLRKHIAYARQTCFPTLTDEAKEAIKDFYVDFRSKGVDSDAPVPMSARKLEAIVRLAEASARIRLSDHVGKQDADRVIDIARRSLRDIGLDPNTGEFDADIVETGQQTYEDEEFKDQLKSIIESLESEYDEGAPISQVISTATTQLNDNDEKVERGIENLRRTGEVYEPRTDYLRTT